MGPLLPAAAELGASIGGRFTAPTVLIVAAEAVAIRIGSGITLVDPNFVGILPPRCRCSLAT